MRVESRCESIEVRGVEIFVGLFVRTSRHQLVAMGQFLPCFDQVHVGAHIVGHLEVDQLGDEFIPAFGINGIGSLVGIDD